MKNLNSEIVQWGAIALSLIISGVSIYVSFGHYAPRLNADSFILGVLSILVTILIGWQVLSVINLDKMISKQIDEKVRSTVTENISMYHNVVDASITFNYYLHYYMQENYTRAIYGFLLAIKQATHSERGRDIADLSLSVLRDIKDRTEDKKLDIQSVLVKDYIETLQLTSDVFGFKVDDIIDMINSANKI